MRLSFLLPALIALASACSTTPPKTETPPAALAETSAPASGPKCSDDTFCTREYLPTTCQFGGENFSGSNPCEAKKLAKHFACEKGLPFTDDKVACTRKEEKPLAAAKDCNARVFCTKEMNPHSCTFSGEKFRGNNRCEALQKVRAFACERGLVLDEKALVCEPAKGKRENAG